MKFTELDYYMQICRSNGNLKPSDWDTPAYHTAVAPYLLEIEQMEHRILPFTTTYAELFETQKAAVTTWEYGKGGITIPRGFYCPCPTIDCIAVGTSRGRLIKNISSRTKPDYLFGINNQKQLLVVEMPDNSGSGIISREAILHTKSETLGLRFSEHHNECELIQVILCEYEDGQIRTMRCGTMGCDGKTLQELQINEYLYADGGLQEQVITDILRPDFYSFPRVFRRALRFLHDSVGNLSAFWTSYDNGVLASAAPHIYSITVKRKI